MLPKTIRIGAYDIEIDVVDNLIRDQGACGRYLPCEKRIEIESNMTTQMQRGVFMHEIIEAITEIYVIDALADDHGAIDTLGEVLHQILKDNPNEMLME